MASTNMAMADTIFNPNTIRYDQPSVVCVNRSNMRYAPVRSSTPVQIFTMRLKSAAICAATAGAVPLPRSAGKTATRYRMLPPPHAAPASVCAARTSTRISNIIFQIFVHLMISGGQQLQATLQLFCRHFTGYTTYYQALTIYEEGRWCVYYAVMNSS